MTRILVLDYRRWKQKRYTLESHGLTGLVEGSGGPGQKTETVVALGEQASKPILYCRVERRNKELRLCDEAIEQGGVRNGSESCGVRAINCKMQMEI